MDHQQGQQPQEPPQPQEPQQPDFDAIAQDHIQLSEVHANLASKMQLCTNLPAIEQGARILQRLEELANNVNTRFTAMDNQFTTLTGRFTAVEDRFTALEDNSAGRSLAVDTRLTAIESTLRTK